MELDENLSLGIALSPSVVEAQAMVTKLMKDQRAVIALFGGVSRLVVADITEEEIMMLFGDTFLNGCSYCVDRLPNALMMCSPYPNVSKRVTRPVLYYDCFFACVQPADQVAYNRQMYLHIVKELHELSHGLTPALMRLFASRKSNISYRDTPLKKAKTPPKIGQLHARQGDMGNGLEEDVFGGRIIPHPEFLLKPFAAPLCLRTAIDTNKIADNNNCQIVVINDDYITRILGAVRSWQPGSAPVNFLVPFSACVVAGTGTTEGPKLAATKPTDSRSAHSRYLDMSELSQIMQGDEDSDDNEDYEEVGVLVGGAFSDVQAVYLQKGFRF